MSRVRLSVRNIPLTMSEATLRKIFINKVRDDYKDAGKPTRDIDIVQVRLLSISLFSISKNKDLTVYISLYMPIKLSQHI